MRRQGYELLISPPRILTHEDEKSGQVLEPFEEVTVDVDAEYSGTVVVRSTRIWCILSVSVGLALISSCAPYAVFIY